MREGKKKTELHLYMAEVDDDITASMAELDSGAGRPWGRYTAAPRPWQHVIIGLIRTTDVRLRRDVGLMWAPRDIPHNPHLSVL